MELFSIRIQRTFQLVSTGLTVQTLNSFQHGNQRTFIKARMADDG